MKLAQKKCKPENLSSKDIERKSITNKELLKLKEKYKSGKLKFDSKKIAEGILKDLKFGPIR